MGTISPERSFRYLSVMTQRKWRLLRRGDEHARHEVTRFARNGIIFLASLATLGAAAYEYVSHANDFLWRVDPHGKCMDAGFVAFHEVQPNEHVVLYVRPTMGKNTRPGVEFDISGDPIAAGIQEFCFEQEELADAGIIFQAENGTILGKEEIYQH